MEEVKKGRFSAGPLTFAVRHELWDGNIQDHADQGVAILFYSTDYDELIGMCDRVSILYRGAIVRTLEGDSITEHNIVAASLSVGLGSTTPFDEDRPHG